MAKFVFIVPPLTGHINPTLGLGQGLLDKGHEVAWISFDPELEKQLPKNGELLLIPVHISEEEKKSLKLHMEDLSKKSVYGIDSLKFLYDEVLLPMNTYILEGIEELLESYSPDVVITDHQIFAGAVASIRKNIVYVTSVTAPASIKESDTLPMVHEWESQQVISFQKKFGIESEKRLDCSETLTLVYTSKQFFGSEDLSESYKFIGPIITERNNPVNFDWEKFEQLNGNKKILVSIGTTFDHTQKNQFFKKVVEALGDKNLSVVVVSDPELFEYIPNNFLVQKQVPQLELLPEMDAVVCHGGNNTVCETLSFGIPLVVLPIAYDQSYVAGCIVDNEAGIRLKFNRFKASYLEEAVNSVLNEPKYKVGAKKIQLSFKKAGGIAEGVNSIENIVNS